MQIHLSDDGSPLYQQVFEQIRHRILAGQLEGGHELPAIRTLAERLRVNPNTIARAYRELEQAGLVEKRRTRGTFVIDRAAELSASQRKSLLHPLIDQLLVLARSLGVERPDLERVMDQREKQLAKSLKKGTGP